MIDLARKHLTSLDVRGRVRLGEAIADELMKSCLDQDDREAGTATFIRGYSRMRIPHFALGVVHRVESSEEYAVRLHVGLAERVRRAPRGIHSPVEMLRCLSKLEPLVQFNCEVRFLYPIDEFATVIGLPIEYSGPGVLPFTSIRGYHVEKLEKDKVVYEAIVDHRRDLEDMYLHLEFTYESQFREDLLKSIMHESTQLASLFVIER